MFQRRWMENDAREGVAVGGRWKSKHRAQKLTRECALCAVSEPEASPYCVSPRVAFVSVLVAPIVFCPHLCHPLASSSSAATSCTLLSTPLLFRRLVSFESLESLSPEKRTREVCRPIKGTWLVPFARLRNPLAIFSLRHFAFIRLKHPASSPRVITLGVFFFYKIL